MEAIAILGGTGKEGRGLALRFALHGCRVILGSRGEEKARRIASDLNHRLAARAAGGEAEAIEGETNAAAARRGDVIVSTLPHDGHLETIRSLGEALAGKTIVTATIRWPPGLDGALSAAEELQEALAGTARVAAAFQTVSAKTLASLDEPADDEADDVLVFADEPTTRREAMELVGATGLRAVEAGPLSKTRVAEALTGVLLGVNKLYGVRSTGIRITGLPTVRIEP